jgi:hypothetical protein
LAATFRSGSGSIDGHRRWSHRRRRSGFARQADEGGTLSSYTVNVDVAQAILELEIGNSN